MDITAALNKVNGACKPIMGLVMNLAVLFLVVGVVFPSTGGTTIIGSVSGVVDTFLAGGLAGLITLMVFMAVWRD
jgi:hypothetical protein